MDFNNGLYVFNGVPGLDASKGERILKALQKLQAKMKHLEQIRESEREKSSKEIQVDKDLTMADVKFKLLVLQLQYMRAVLRKNISNVDSLPQEPDKLYSQNVEQRNMNSKATYKKIQSNCKETQTGMSLCEPYKDNERTCVNFPLTEEQSATESFEPTARSTKLDSKHNYERDNLPIESISASSKDPQLHYHLKFDDVPFILGASSSASHNIVANVQNIIAMMKTHNKVLCGSKHHVSRNCTVAGSDVKSSSQDTNKILKNLSDELTELQRKQAKLIEKFDTAQSGNHLVDARNIEKQNKLELNENYEKKYSSQESRNVRFTSNINSVGNSLEERNKEFKKKEKHAVPTNCLKSNFPQVSRRKLLRSIQDFKTHLSEEDISWV